MPGAADLHKTVEIRGIHLRAAARVRVVAGHFVAAAHVHSDGVRRQMPPRHHVLQRRAACTIPEEGSHRGREAH